MKERFSRQDRKASLMRGMQVGLIPNTAPNYNMNITTHDEPSSREEQISQLKTVTLLQLRPFDNNPRKMRNPKFDEIKESIRVRGLDFPPNITQRPGETHYIIADGGNTRLQALQELYEETQDPKYFSITCLFKPWQGSADDNISGDLHCLIGHLAENDLRGDLTFIERALGIQQAKQFYQQQEDTVLSHRKLSERLKADGYSISHSLLVKMEQCIDLLYPAIPQLLLNGMGKPQIEKLLQLFSNANTYWEKYTPLFHHSTGNFKQLWLDTLSPLDNDTFSLDIFQDELIGNMVKEIGSDYVSYQDIQFELTHKPKHQENTAIDLITQEDQENSTIETVENDEPFVPAPTTKIQADKQLNQTLPTTSQNTTAISHTETNSEYDEDVNTENMPNEENDTTSSSISDDVASTFDIFSQFGISPGQSISEQRQQRAIQNGIEFANTGCQPVNDIWQIYPAFDTPDKLRLEAYGLATDIANIVHLKQSIIPLDSNFSFTLSPLSDDIEDELTISIHALLSCLACDNHQESLTLTLTESVLVGMENQPEISDLLLVKIFRLIRVVRQLRQHLRSHV
ncbi:ParB family protein [Gallibacterium anatis]|uniref:Chromosomal partitioning protein ParB n=1 Tax=Gallibacterium anatis 4895 TaxID=1396510 RepID=A0A0A3A8L4_9PAST|nr:ParB family protein [Gallibacterium anatis]KGQ64082.1 chromosomal partitioning protein ParB [Gallibacterium anatis 4895]